MEKKDRTLHEPGGQKRAKTRMTVALAQIDATNGDRKTNAKTVHGLLARHREEVDLLVLPEYSLTGFVGGKDALEAAIDIDGPELDEIVQDTAGITLGLNFIERSDGRTYDSLAFIRDSHIVAVHRKIYLVGQGPFNEGEHFSPGSEHRCFNVGAFRLAPFICADAWNPALVHLAAMDQASVMVFVAGSSTTGLTGRLSTRESWRRINRFYSSIYGCYVLFVNRTGQDDEVDFWGGSQILNPYGEILGESQTEGESVIMADIDLELPWRARRELPAFTHRDISFTPSSAASLNETMAQPIEHPPAREGIV